MQLLSNKITGGSLSASEWNQVPEEIENIITAMGIALSSGDLNQLGKGIAGYVAQGDFYDSSGPANDYILTAQSGIQGPPAYLEGMRVRFVPNINNTGGAVTVNVNSLGVRSVVREDGVGLSSAVEFNTAFMAELRFDSGANNFKLRRIQDAGTGADEFGLTKVATQAEVNSGNNTFSYVTAATLNAKTAQEGRRGGAEIASQAETDTGTDDERIVTPLKLATRLDALGSDDIDNDSSISGTTVSDALETLDATVQAVTLNDTLTSVVNIPNSTPVTVFSFTTVVNATHRFVAYCLASALDVNTTTWQIIHSSGATLSATRLTYIQSADAGSTSLRGPLFTVSAETTVTTGSLLTIPDSDISDASSVLVKVEGFVDDVSSAVTFELRVANTTASTTVIISSGSMMQVIPVDP